MTPVALVILEQRVRPDAGDTSTTSSDSMSR